MPELRLNLGSGKHVKEGFDGVDIIDYGQKYILDLRKGLPIFKDSSVSEIFCQHFIEHIDQDSIYKLLEECTRVMKSGAIMHIVVPHKDNPKAYILWHKTFFTEETFKDLETKGFNTIELITNARGDIHWKWRKK